MTFTPHDDAIGTICFLSYNRGKLLLRTIEDLLPKLSKQWPILVCNNASTEFKEDYDKIARLASNSNSLFYFRHENNCLFEGNLLSLFDLVPTQFFLVVSDEDVPSIKALDEIGPFLSSNRDIGAVQTSLGAISGAGRTQAHNKVYSEFSKGTGVTSFGLTGNYITGVIYNAPLLREFNVPQRLKKNVRANQWYPHLYLNILAAANTRTVFSPVVSCYQGVAATQTPKLTTDYFGVFSYGTRLDQFMALRNVIYEAFLDIQGSSEDKEFDMSAFYTSYFGLCSKYAYLIFMLQGKMYRDQFIDIDFLAKSFSIFCIGAVENMPNYEHIKDRLAMDIGRIVEIHLTNSKKLAEKMNKMDEKEKKDKLDAMLRESKALIEDFTSLDSHMVQS